MRVFFYYMPFAGICQEENASAGAPHATFSAKRFEMIGPMQYIYCVNRSRMESPLPGAAENRTFIP